MTIIRYINAKTNQIFYEEINASFVSPPNTIVVIEEITYVVYQIIKNVDAGVVNMFCFSEFEYLLMKKESDKTE
jgi:hypothetical protein